MTFTKEHIVLACKASIEAGQDIMHVYENESFDVDFKSDDSPLTKADLKSHERIMSFLNQTDFPVLSEEGAHAGFEERKDWPQLWIVDPLDGTKEFIKRNGEFTVNIAFIENNAPVFGVIYVPAQEILYFGGQNLKSYKLANVLNHSFNSLDELISLSESLNGNTLPEAHTIVASRSHLSEETEAFISERKSKYGEVKTVSMGSSLKICLVAENKAHVYPRYAPTMEWDTAAGHAIVIGAGKELIDYQTKSPMTYNREQLRNNWFIVE